MGARPVMEHLNKCVNRTLFEAALGLICHETNAETVTLQDDVNE